MRCWLRLGCLAAAVWLILGTSAHAVPLRIGFGMWVGLGPLFVAQEEGLFAQEGIEVELIDMEIPEALYRAVAEVLAFVYQTNKALGEKRPGSSG